MIHNFYHNDLREHLTLVAYESFFISNQVLYKQSDGAAVGSLLDLILANAFLCHFEKRFAFRICP